MDPVDDPRTLRLPPRAASPERSPFPLVGSIAPVVGALAIWGITRSPFVLMFALLGPCVAVASLADARRSGRRALRRARVVERRALADLHAMVGELQRRQRTAAWERTPPAARWLRLGEGDAARFSRRGVVMLTLGSAPGRSLVSVTPDDPGAEADERRDALVRAAQSTDDLPVVADPLGGIGVVGAAALARSLVTGLLLQACAAAGPETLRVALPPGAEWSWARALPHVQSEADTVLRVMEAGERPGDADALIVIAPAVRDLPAGVSTILLVREGRQAELLRADGPLHCLLPELVGRAQAERLVSTLSRAAPTRPLATRVQLGELVQPDADEQGLQCTIGRDTEGDVRIDLAADGPHAVIGGTTGSGKSELLVSWVAAMATRLPPESFTFLLVDFKGGATATALSSLPHCVGVASDLDDSLAQRVLISLGAELRHRERLLAAAGVTDIRDLPTLARLVVVVDELAALIAAAPDAHATLTDIAARGRSLGVHLVLCTQRPAGVVRDTLLANCGLRIALRVIDGPDSSAVVGTDAAARLPAGVPGRCIINRHGERLRVQAAVTSADDIARIARRWAGAVEPRRPWLPPLPAVLAAAHPALEVAAGAAPAGSGIVLGIIDEPALQRQRVVRWSPAEHGNLLVVGSRGCGASSLLHRVQDAIGASGPPRDEEELWDRLTGAAPEPTLIIDDWDALAARWGPEHRQSATDALAARLRESRGGVVLATRRPTQLGSLAAMFGRTLVLRVDDRAEHLGLGAPAAFWNADAPPGRGTWEGAQFQAILPTSTWLRRPPPAPPEVPRDEPLLVVTASPHRTTRLISERWPDRLVIVPDRDALQVVAANRQPILVADVEGWLALGSTVAALRQRSVMVFDGCSLGDVRQLAGTRALPPAICAGASRVWLRLPDGRLERGRWPDRAPDQATDQTADHALDQAKAADG